MGESITLAKTCGCMFLYVIIGTGKCIFSPRGYLHASSYKVCEVYMKIMQLLNSRLRGLRDCVE